MARKDSSPKTDPLSVSSRVLMGRLWRDYVRQHRIWIAVAALLMLVEGGTLGFLSYMLKPMFDRVFVGGELGAIWGVAAAVMGLFVVRALTGIGNRVILSRIAQLTATEMQTDLLAHIMRLDGGFFAENPPGALIERVQGDTAAVQNIWQAIIQGAGRDMVALVSLGAVAFTIDITWAFAAIVGVPLLIAPSVVLQKYVRRKVRQMRMQSHRRATRLDEIFHGIDAVKLNAMEGYQLDRFRKVVGQILRNQVKSAAGRATMPGLVDIITGLGFCAVLVFGGRDIAQGTKTVGEFMSFFTAMALAFQPLRRLGGLAGTMQTAAASLENVYGLFDTAPSIAPGGVAMSRPDAPPHIALCDVEFAYGDAPVLNGCSFTAAPGRVTALVGASGAGKSTVFKLLTRLADPQAGQVEIDGQDTRDLALEDLRGLFSVVSQDSLLFDETIRENITLGRSDVDPARLAAATAAAHVDDFVSTLPRGLDTPAGPRGSGLSGGQRQRVAIARAILRDTPILLLDEATSALDARSEALIQEALGRLSEGRTTIVIAHRLATIRDADRIVVMEEGRVVQQGTHDDLLAEGGLYATLHALQVQGADPAET